MPLPTIPDKSHLSDLLRHPNVSRMGVSYSTTGSAGFKKGTKEKGSYGKLKV